MKTFGRTVKLGAGLVAVMALAAGSTWAGEFSDKVERIFSPSVIGSVKELGSVGEVEFKVPERMPEYFEAGDKANKILAIDSARLFRELPGLERLALTIPKGEKQQRIDLSRADIEKYYKVSFTAMNKDQNLWRNEFIQTYDNKASRAQFVDHFVTEQ